MALFVRVYQFLDSIPGRRGPDLLRCSLLAFAATWIVAQLVSFTIIAIFSGPETIDSAFTTRSGRISALLLAPFLETLGMRGMFWLLRRLRRSKTGLLGWSSLLWWIAHLSSDSWGVPAAGTFWVMGVLYLAFERRSTDQAMVYVSLFHLAFNGLAYLLYAYMHL
jgi:hypothetical protein